MIGFFGNIGHISMKRFISAVLIGAAAAVALAQPAFAQRPTQPDLTPLQEQDAAKKKEHEAVDQQYKRTMQTTTGASTTKVDPWANMRAPDDSKPKK